MKPIRAMCVAWRERSPRYPFLQTKRIQWCAAADNLDPTATSDRTLCGMVVTLRLGSAYRTPTCEYCKRALERKAKA